MNLAKYIFATGLIFSTSAFAAEIKIGQNKLSCVNEHLGSFEMDFTVSEKVVEVEYFKTGDQPATPAWESLETKLDSVLYTSGSLIEPSGVAAHLKGATMKVSRYVGEGASKGKIQASMNFPKAFSVVEWLLIDHNHPEKYGTKELGAQTFVSWAGTAQVFFKCHE